MLSGATLHFETLFGCGFCCFVAIFNNTMKKLTLRLAFFTGILALASHKGFGQDSTKTKKWFIGYEMLEMSMNRFQYFAGEVGYRIDPKNQVRLVVCEVKLTEEHLANTWQSLAVDGPNVDGYLRVYDLYYDRFFGRAKNLYYGANVGYKNDQYNYLLGSDKIDNHTATVGFQFGYQQMNLFHVKHLYINFSMPFRYYFHAIPETQWGETKILPHQFINNIWFFVGYNF